MSDRSPHEETLFDVARTMADPTARRAFLDQACAKDAALRERLEKLLEAEEGADEFFKAAAPFPTPNPDRPPTNGIKGGEGNSLADQVGMRIGRYKLLQKIGEGGCGV